VENQTLMRRAEAIANDRDRGAAELLAQTLPLLAEALDEGRAAAIDVARVVCKGQPAMAPLWNACAAAVADFLTPGRFARVRAEMERAPAALVRAAGVALADALRDQPAPLLLTLSYSSSVAQVLASLVRTTPFAVVCGEGRPRFEGRRLATELAAAGARVTLTTDAALTAYLPSAAAVVAGADAVARDHWINKVGTRGLAAAAALAGVPTYAISTRSKALAQPLATRAELPQADGAEVWTGAPPGLEVANPYFERIPVELATLFLCDSGPIAPGDIAAISERFAADISHLINELN